MTANTLFSLRSEEPALNMDSRPAYMVVPVVGLILICPETSKVALFQRGPDQSGAGDWEFPGGKVELNETFSEALVREIQEELGLSLVLSAVTYCGTVVHAYPQKTIQIWFFTYPFSSKKSSELRLTDHKAVAWVEISHLNQYPLSAADQKYVRSRFET